MAEDNTPKVDSGEVMLPGYSSTRWKRGYLSVLMLAGALLLLVGVVLLRPWLF